jgi:hypothetical protein
MKDRKLVLVGGLKALEQPLCPGLAWAEKAMMDE